MPSLDQSIHPSQDSSQRGTDSTRFLLTIAIPTFNRCALLQATLETIVSQVEPLKDEVELLVANNGSPDGTAEMLMAFARRYPFLKTTIRQTLDPIRTSLFASARRSVASSGCMATMTC